MKQSAPVPVKPLAFQDILASGLLGMIPEPWQRGKTSPWPMVKHTQERHGRELDGPIQTDAINHFTYSTIWATLSRAQGHPHVLLNALALLEPRSLSCAASPEAACCVKQTHLK